MPELPEIEVLRRELEREVVGRKIKTADAPTAKAVARNGNKKLFAARVEGAKVVGVSRVGTLLVSELDTGDRLYIDLGDDGQLIRAQPREAVTKDTRVVISFTQGGQLRVLGGAGAEVFVAAPEEIDAMRPDLAQIGFDPIDQPMSWAAFGERLLRERSKVKSVLMDPTFVVGIGPMYSDEILFEAGVRYDRVPEKLSLQEVRRLYRAVVEIMHDAVKYGGTSLPDRPFADLSGKPGEYAQYLNVFGRDGQMSPRARGPIVKARFAGGWSYYCEQTQA